MARLVPLLATASFSLSKSQLNPETDDKLTLGGTRRQKASYNVSPFPRDVGNE